MDTARDLPWNCTDPNDIGPAVMRYCYYHEPYFRKWSETWFVIMQYVFGQHNFRWSARNGYAVDSDILSKRTANNGVRSYTNIARIAVESLASGFYANNPTWEVDLVSDSATFGRKQRELFKSYLMVLLIRFWRQKILPQLVLFFRCLVRSHLNLSLIIWRVE